MSRAVVVEIGDAAGQFLLAWEELATLPLQHRSERFATVFLGEVQQHGAVDISRVDLFQAFEAALFPMAEQVAIQEAGPAGAAFKERHVEAREAARYTAEEHRLAGRVVGRGEMADMVVDEIRRRQ